MVYLVTGANVDHKKNNHIKLALTMENTSKRTMVKIQKKEKGQGPKIHPNWLPYHNIISAETFAY